MFYINYKVRQKLTLFLFFYSIYGFAQLYVKQGTVLTIGSSDALLSSQEKYHQIDASIQGEGTLVLNNTSVQQLTSLLPVLELPTLRIKNASLVKIQTALLLKNKLFLDRGVLQLSHTLTLPDPSSLVFAKTASILTSSLAFLSYKSELLHTDTVPLAAVPSMQFFYFEPNSPIPTDVVEYTVWCSDLRVPLQIIDYDIYIQQITPPPKVS